MERASWGWNSTSKVSLWDIWVKSYLPWIEILPPKFRWNFLGPANSVGVNPEQRFHPCVFDMTLSLRPLAEGVLQSWCGVAWKGESSVELSGVAQKERGDSAVDGSPGWESPQMMSEPPPKGFLGKHPKMLADELGVILQQALLNRVFFFTRRLLVFREWLKGAIERSPKDLAKHHHFWGASFPLENACFVC